jgi:hypothetical protein
MNPELKAALDSITARLDSLEARASKIATELVGLDSLVTTLLGKAIQFEIGLAVMASELAAQKKIVQEVHMTTMQLLEEKVN